MTVKSPSRLRRSLWWIFLARAGVAIALGLSVLLAGQTRPALVNFIAVYWLIGALLTVRWVLANRWQPGSRLALGAAVVGASAGIAVLARGLGRGLIDEDVLVDLLGVSAILTGAIRLFGGFHDDQVGQGRPRLSHRIPLGVLEVVLGVGIIVAGPESAWFLPLIGIWALAGGTLLFLDALALHRQLSSRENSPSDADRSEGEGGFEPPTKRL